MLYIILIVIIIFAFYFIKDKLSYSSVSSKTQEDENYSDSYQSVGLFTSNEKSEFEKLLSWANDNGLYAFPKVRIFNIIEPRNDKLNYIKLLWKIHSKHIDFVICDKALQIKFLIALDDNSCKKENYIKRDEFLQEALSGAGYTVIHTDSINESFLASLDVAQ